MTTLYLVHDGEAHPPLAGCAPAPCARVDYGHDWIMVEAPNEADALAQADAWDHGQHPAQVEMQLYRAMYRARADEGTVIAADDWLDLGEAADLLGLSRTTLRGQIVAGRLRAWKSGKRWTTDGAAVYGYAANVKGRAGKYARKVTIS